MAGGPALDARQANELLEPLVGEWSMAVVMPGQATPDELLDVGARVRFEWMGSKPFVAQSWTVPIAAAPDGLALMLHGHLH